MESSVIELLKPVTLQKENCDPIIFEAGTVLKVVMQTPTSLLVSNDDDFNFTIPLKDKNEVWREIWVFFPHANRRVVSEFGFLTFMIRPLAFLHFDCSFIIFSKNYFFPLLSSFIDFKLAHIHLSKKFCLIETSFSFVTYVRSLMICFRSFVSTLSLRWHLYISSLCLAQLHLIPTLRFKKKNIQVIFRVQ